MNNMNGKIESLATTSIVVWLEQDFEIQSIYPVQSFLKNVNSLTIN